MEFKTHWTVGSEPKRVVMDAWSRNYALYASNGVNITTESYRKTCGLCAKKWRDSAVEFLKVDATTVCYPSVNGVGGWETVSKSAQVTSYHHVQQVLEYVVAVVGAAWIDTQFIDCTYTYKRDDNNQLVSERFIFEN
jgi:hypothetical protein